MGSRKDIPAAAKKYKIQEIVVAIPTLAPGDKKEILEICKETGCKLRLLPGVYQLIQ